MARSFAPSRQSVFLFFLLIVVVFSFGGYYYRYVSGEEEYFTLRDFRHLAIVGDQINSRVEGLVTALDNEIQKSDQDLADTTLQKRFKSLFSDYDDSSIPSRIPKHTAITNRTATASFESSPDRLLLRIDYAFTLGAETHRLMLKVRGINAVLTRKKTERVFDELFIAQRDGNRIVQSPQSNIKIVKLDTLNDLNGSLVRFQSVAQRDGVVKLSTMGEEYRLFVHPLIITNFGAESQADNPSAGWSICGLIKSNTFVSDTLAIPYNFLILFLLVTLLATLSWPLLKLKFMNRFDRIRNVDVIFVVLSLTLITSILTFTVLDGLAMVHIDSTVDSQLKSLSGSISTNFRTEIVRADSQLMALTTQKRTDIYKAITKGPKSKGGDLLLDKGTQIYPYFDLVFWTNSDGDQCLKLTVKSPEYSTSLVSVSDRPYFTNAREGLLWTLRDTSHSPLRLVLQPVWSKTTGEFSSSLATPINFDRSGNFVDIPSGGSTKGVAVMDMRPMSLVSPVLPSGFGFSVIDDEGRALFHSNRDRNLLENFFDECDDAKILKGAVLARSAEFVTTNYAGRAHRIYVQPVRDIPWSLVTFADKDIIRASNFEVVSVSLLLYLLYTVPFVAAFIVLTVRGKNGKWAWPDPSKGHIYAYIRKLSLALSALFLAVWLLWPDPITSFWVGFYIPHVGLVLSWLALRSGERRKPASSAIWIVLGDGAILSLIILLALKSFSEALPTLAGTWLALLGGWAQFTRSEKEWNKLPSDRDRLSFRKLTDDFSWTSLLLLFLCTMLPSISFFRLAYEAQTRLYLKQTQLLYAQTLHQRDDDIRRQFVQTKTPDRSAFITQRLHQSLDIYTNFIYRDMDSISDRPSQDLETKWFDALILHKIMPAYNETAAQEKVLALNPADTTVQWVTVQSGRGKMLTLQQALPQRGHGVAAKTRFRQLGSPYPSVWEIFPGLAVRLPFLLFVVLLAILGSLLWLLLRFVLKRIFLLETDDPPQFPIHETDPRQITRNTLLTPRSSSDAEALQAIMADRSIDVASACVETKKEEWTYKISHKEIRERPAIILNHFDFRASDPAVNAQKLLMLENLLFMEGKPVVLISSIDPLSNFVLVSAGSKQEELEFIVSRWNRVLSSFVRIAWQPVQDRDESGKKKGTFEPEDLPKALRDFFTQELLHPVVLKYHRELKQLGDSLRTMDKLGLLVPTQLNDVIYERAKTYYSRLWSSCSWDEKLVLVRLAEDSFVSSRNNAPLESLLRKGLVKREPDFRPFNETFIRFILDAQRPEDIQPLGKQETRTGWGVFRIPLLIILLGGALFLFTTQRDLWTMTLTFVSATAALVPALFRIFGSLQPGRGANLKET